MTASSMTAMARRDLGLRGRPNRITNWYADRGHGSYFRRAPWCNMAVTRWAHDSGNYQAVCFGKDWAYTVWHAQEFQRRGRWTYGVRGIKPGDIIFFQWEGGAGSIGKIDHVGVVEKVLSGGRVQTIEGNTGDACLRRVRSGSIITGYGRPDYSDTGNGNISEEELMYGLKRGDKGPAVKLLQYRVRLCGKKYADMLGKYGPNKDGVDGEYGGGTEKAVGAIRKDYGSSSGQGKSISEYSVGQIEFMLAVNASKRK